MIFNPDGNLLLTGGSDGFLRIWKPKDNYHNFEKIAEREAFGTLVKDAHWSHDGKYIVAVPDRSGDAKIYEFANNSFKLLHSLKPSEGHEFNGCRFGTSSQQLFTSEMIPRKSGKIASWSISPKGCTRSKIVQVCTNYHHTVVDISACGEFLAFASVKGDIVVLRSSNLSQIMSVHVHELPITRLVFTKKTKRTTNTGGSNGPHKEISENLAVISCGLDRAIVISPVRESQCKCLVLCLLLHATFWHFHQLFSIEISVFSGDHVGCGTGIALSILPVRLLY